MLTYKTNANWYRRHGEADVAAVWDAKHDEIHQEIKDLLALDDLIGSVKI